MTWSLRGGWRTSPGDHDSPARRLATDRAKDSSCEACSYLRPVRRKDGERDADHVERVHHLAHGRHLGIRDRALEEEPRVAVLANASTV